MYEVMEYTIMSDVYDEYIDMHPAIEAFGKKESLWDKIVGVFKLIIKKIKKFFYRISGQEKRDRNTAIAAGGTGVLLVGAFCGLHFYEIKNKNQLRDSDILRMKEDTANINKKVQTCRDAMEKIKANESSKGEQKSFCYEWIRRQNEITKNMENNLNAIEVIRNNTEGDKHLKKLTDEQETILKEYAAACQSYLQLANELQKFCENYYPNLAKAISKGSDLDKAQNKDFKNIKDQHDIDREEQQKKRKMKKKYMKSEAEKEKEAEERTGDEETIKALRQIKAECEALGYRKKDESRDIVKRRKALRKLYDKYVYGKSAKDDKAREDRRKFIIKYGD